MGAPTWEAGAAVRRIFSNLSVSLPLLTPQKSQAFAISSVVRFITNSPLSLIILYECLSGRREI